MSNKQIPCGQLLTDDRMSEKAVLVAGKATVKTVCASVSKQIFLTSCDSGVTGALRVENIVEGVSFDIVSSNPADAGNVAWIIFCNI